MKTVQINSVCQYGSTGRIAVDINKSLREEEIEDYVFFGVGESSYEYGRHFGSNLNVVSHQIKTRLLGKHGFYSRHATKELVSDLEKLSPDLIHLHNLHGHYLNVEVLFEFLKKSKIPVIWTLHDCWSFTGHCAHFDFIGCNKWKSECKKCPQLREYPKSLVFDRSRESFRDKKSLFTGLENLTIVTPSDWLRHLLSDSFLSAYTATTIHGGIDTEVFHPLDSSFRRDYSLEDKFIILAVANFWTEKKGYNYILELSESLKSDEVIVIVGVSESQKATLPSNIIGITRTQSLETLVEVYSAADVFVNPTLEETLSLVNVESLAAGTPVITFNTGGCPETVDKDTGIVVERGNLEKMLEAKDYIKTVGKNAYSEACIKRAKTYFTTDEMSKNYVRLYKRVLHTKE